jgi:predicted DsbA family dithiol-disulfide isomerase
VEENMSVPLKIDFVSDVSCPWCVIGLYSLEQALSRVGDRVSVTLRFQPFELNPDLDAEGQDVIEHLQGKYGSTAEQIKRNGETIRARGAEVGFTFDMEKRTRVYNTFDAHRLLHWSADSGKQEALKRALFRCYFTDGGNPSAHETLLRLVSEVGLDAERAGEILSSDMYASEVRSRERFYQSNGISAVPSIIIDDQHLIQGGQPVDLFERALLRIASEKGSVHAAPA